MREIFSVYGGYIILSWFRVLLPPFVYCFRPLCLCLPEDEADEFNDNMEAWFEEETPALEEEPVQEELSDDQEILQQAFHGDDEDHFGIESALFMEQMAANADDLTGYYPFKMFYASLISNLSKYPLSDAFLKFL